MSRLGAGPSAHGLLVTLALVLVVAGRFGVDRLGYSGLAVPERLLVFPFVLLAAFLLWSRAGGRAGPRLRQTVVALLALLGLTLASALWGPVGYGTGSVVLDLLTMGSIVLVFAMLSSADPLGTVRLVAWLLLVIGASYATVGLLTGQDAARLSILGGGPNVYGRVTGMGLLTLVYLVATRRLHPLAWVLAPFLGAATVLSGSRGAMLATAVAALPLMALLLRRLTLSGLAAGTLGFLLMLAGLSRTSLWDRALFVVDTRVTQLTLVERHTSGREDLAEPAIRLWAESPLVGAGLGAYTNEVGYDIYPHNLVLSIGAASGVVGVVTLLAVLALAVRNAVASPYREEALVISGLALLILVSSMFSGGLYDSRFLLVFLVLLAAIAQPVGVAHRRVGFGLQPSTRRPNGYFVPPAQGRVGQPALSVRDGQDYRGPG